MHPQYKSVHPGDAPCCGMRLEPVYAGSESGTAGPAVPDGSLQISPAQQQLIGVRLGDVERARASHMLRVPGRITVDESRLCRIIAATDGWIRQLGPYPTGTFVAKQQILASYYTRDLLTAQQSLFYALNTNGQVQKGQLNLGAQTVAGSLNVQVAVDSLRSLGMSDLQIQELRQSAVTAPEIHVYAPIAGFVIARGVSPEQRFEKGSEIYRIADLSHVWVMTDIFEKDREFLKPGTKANVHYQGQVFEARLSDALPQFDPQSRTLKTRFELDNPGYNLRPDMFVDVQIHVSMPEAVTVPAEAVLDSGDRKTVYVGLGNGSLEPRAVETGWRLGDRVQITKGLVPGEQIVISGNFLVDSESRMKLAGVSAAPAAEKAATEKDPVCSMDVSPKAPDALNTRHGGKTYYFCSDHCKKAFEAKPDQYVPKQAVQEIHGGRKPA